MKNSPEDIELLLKSFRKIQDAPSQYWDQLLSFSISLIEICGKLAAMDSMENSTKYWIKESLLPMLKVKAKVEFPPQLNENSIYELIEYRAFLIEGLSTKESPLIQFCSPNNNTVRNLSNTEEFLNINAQYFSFSVLKAVEVWLRSDEVSEDKKGRLRNYLAAIQTYGFQDNERNRDFKFKDEANNDDNNGKVAAPDLKDLISGNSFSIANAGIATTVTIILFLLGIILAVIFLIFFL